MEVSLDVLAWGNGILKPVRTIQGYQGKTVYQTLENGDDHKTGFKCQACGDVRHKPIKVVTETRQVTYKTGHKGTEIVKEKMICQRCNFKFQGIIK